MEDDMAAKPTSYRLSFDWRWQFPSLLL
jgi:hypothetical protein